MNSPRGRCRTSEIMEHTFASNADGTLQEDQYFGSHPRSPLAPRAEWRGASGPASERFGSAAGGRDRGRLGSRRSVRRRRRVGGRLRLGRRVVIAIPIPIAPATTRLEAVGDHTKQGSTGARQGLVQTFGDIATIAPEATDDHEPSARVSVAAGAVWGYAHGDSAGRARRRRTHMWPRRGSAL